MLVVKNGKDEKDKNIPWFSYVGIMSVKVEHSVKSKYEFYTGQTHKYLR